MKEVCCQFGPHAQLAGILSEPAVSTRRTSVVLVSAGVTPKFGPFRLYAELARCLAGEGFRTLRFDLGGIGDSGQAYAGYPLEQRTELEIGAALDHLSQSFELDGVILLGLCSGAEDSFRYAEQDRRVTRVVMIDPFAYRTSGFAWRHWRYRARQRLLRAVGLYQPLCREAGKSLVNYAYMAPSESGRILRTLLKRKVRLHFVYTGGMSRHFNHRGQLQAMFRGVDFDGLIQLDHLPHLDHTQAFATDRRILIDRIAARLVE
ncbi:MAG TPA: alpha/beta fold hydrolase [Polyangiaceae bacterium]|nr:alpha/beta fold hydrolase [Polyangiaceae bacterium]